MEGYGGKQVVIAGERNSLSLSVGGAGFCPCSPALI